MFQQPPRRRQLVPPSEEQRRVAAAEAERYRAERAREEARAQPFKQAVLECGGPALRDPQAALACHCGCHPKPASFTLHDGGVTCPCQQDPETRKRAFEELFRFTSELDDEQQSARAATAAAFAGAAEELGVEASVVVGGAPFVIIGVCDGRGFYLRERHGHWRVTIAADDEPAADPWTLDVHEPTYDIATGDEDDLSGPDGAFSPVHALRVAVDAVRTTLTRRACPHVAPVEPDHAYCARCGIRLADASRWTW